MQNIHDLRQLATSLDDSDKHTLLRILVGADEGEPATARIVQSSLVRHHVRDEEGPRRHARAFITAFNFPSSLDELQHNCYEEGGYLNIETLLYPRFREKHPVEWTVPKWAKSGDICLFYFAKTADEKLRTVQREFEACRDSLDCRTERGLEVLLMRGWHYFDNYAGTILAMGRVAGKPYRFSRDNDLDHWKSSVYAEIDEVSTLESPLDISDFRDVVFITRGGTITPVFGSQFDAVRDRIAAKNHVPDYFIDCSTKPLPLREIDGENWMRIAGEYRRGFILEQEFRACYVDYLLQGISDDGVVYRECRTKKSVRGRAKKGFVDNVIMLNGRYLPVEVKLNIEAEKDLPGQCERYCRLGDLFLSEDVSVSRGKVYGGNVLVVDTDGLYLYTSETRSVRGILRFDDVTQESLPVIRNLVARAITQG